MKYEMIKGSEKDFDGASEQVLTVYSSPSVGRYFSSLPSGDAQPPFVSIIAERRPITETVWSGEGLPPVGALCRYRAFSDMPWVECKVLAWHDDEVWLKRTEDGKTFTLGNPELFPICSPEDVARDEGIKEIMQTLRIDGELAPDYVACAMWDAGYRKNPEVSVDDMWREFEKSSDMEDVHKLIYGVKVVVQ